MTIKTINCYWYNELLVLFSFSPWRRFAFKPKYWAISLNLTNSCKKHKIFVKEKKTVFWAVISLEIHKIHIQLCYKTKTKLYKWINSVLNFFFSFGTLYHISYVWKSCSHYSVLQASLSNIIIQKSSQIVSSFCGCLKFAWFAALIIETQCWIR